MADPWRSRVLIFLVVSHKAVRRSGSLAEIFRYLVWDFEAWWVVKLYAEALPPQDVRIERKIHSIPPSSIRHTALP